MIVTSHIAQKVRHSVMDGRTTQHTLYAVSQQRRKEIEEAIGWTKTVGGVAQTVHSGLNRVRAQFTMTMVTSIWPGDRNSWLLGGRGNPDSGAVTADTRIQTATEGIKSFKLNFFGSLSGLLHERIYAENLIDRRTLE